MKLTPSLYSQLVDLVARDCLIDVFGRRIAFCPIEEYPDFPNSLHSTGLVNIDGSAFVYFVDFADPWHSALDPDEVREIREPLSLGRLQTYLGMKAENNAWWSNGREVDSLLLVVRAELSELEIADEVREQARQSGLVIWRLHLKDDGLLLWLDPLEGYDWREERWADLVGDDDLCRPDGDDCDRPDGPELEL